MALTSDGMTPADIAAVTGNNNGWGNDSASWIIILFLFIFMGWGGRFGGFGAPAGGGGATPYQVGTVTQSDMQRGFDQSAVINGINGINASINSGFANAEVSRCNQQGNILQQMGNNQSAVMQQFSQAAYNSQGQTNGIMQGISDIKYVAAKENCDDRNAMNTGFQQMQATINEKTQAILDKMCQQELDAMKRENDNLRQQLYASNLAASQVAQTAQINGNTNAAVNSLRRPAPIPAYAVPNPWCICKGSSAEGTAV